MFILQNTQAHDTKALHIKIDELILKVEGADNKFVHAELKPEKVVEELDKLHEEIDDKV